MTTPFPFSAIVAQDELKLALCIAAIDPAIAGVWIFGDRGTGKSTAVRSLAQLLPSQRVTSGCPYRCDGSGRGPCAPGCPTEEGRERDTATSAVPVVDLPLGATEDRVVGALDLEAALTRGERRFSPGLLAKANRGFLYIDEVNLLPDHLVDLLLDVAASGENVVEREGVSVRHPARFVLVGSGNPEEGELRPQLLDRFGLSVDVRTPSDVEARVEVVKRRMAYELDPDGFVDQYRDDEQALTRSLTEARARLCEVAVPEAVIARAATLCSKLGTDGLRGELTAVRAARAAASLDRETEVGPRHLRRVASLALRHRLRRDVLEDVGSTARIERVVAEVFDA